MEFYTYGTAPNSPSKHARNRTMEAYYSAPTSPQRKKITYDSNQYTGSGQISDHDVGLGQISDFSFEFETSKNFIYFEPSPEFNSQRFDDRFFEQDSKQKRDKERSESLSSVAFADELFVNGLVMPLKLPPRLQYDSDYSNFRPIPSPKSPRTVCRLPFSRKNSSWNDDFDPFTVALEKVREEKRGRSSTAAADPIHHRRSRSYSPFRFVRNRELNKEKNPQKEIQEPARNLSGPLDFKGSVYARWVRDQTQRRGTLGQQQRELKSPRMLSFLAKKVRPLRNEHEGLDQLSSVKEKRDRKDSKVKKLKDVLLRYALLRKENGGSKKAIKGSEEMNKMSYFSRLSFKLKRNDSGSQKKMIVDSKVEALEY